MENEYTVYLNDISDLKNFVNEMAYYIKSDVDAVYENQTIDAKSIIGVMSLASHPIRMIIHSDDLSEVAYFKSICERYEVK